MLVHTDEKLVKTRKRIGQIASFAGMGVLFGGLLYSCQAQPAFQEGTNPSIEAALISWVALIGGFILVSVGRNNSSRWGGQFPAHEVLTNSLKGLDNRHRLYNYAPQLPTDHLLLTPYGLAAFVSRPNFGAITNQGDRWGREGGIKKILMYFAEGSIGNPTRDAVSMGEELKKWLNEQLGDQVANSVPLQTAVVFTHPRASLNVKDPVVPVLGGKDIRAFVRGGDGKSRKARLPTDLRRKLVDVLQVYESADGKPA